MADLDQYSINDVIINSLENRPRSCASNVAAEEGRDPSEADIDSLEQQNILT